MVFSSLLVIAVCYLGWSSLQPKRQAIRIRPSDQRRDRR
jgi:hypothetical protein